MISRARSWKERFVHEERALEGRVGIWCGIKRPPSEARPLRTAALKEKEVEPPRVDRYSWLCVGMSMIESRKSDFKFFTCGPKISNHVLGMRCLVGPSDK